MTLIKNTQTLFALMTAMVSILPFMSGADLQFGFLPESVLIVKYLNPLTYAVALFRTIALGAWDYPLSIQKGMELAFYVNENTVTPIMSLHILLAIALVVMLITTVSFLKVISSENR